MPQETPHRKKKVGITRAKAKELIAALVERAKAVDADPQYLYGVSRMAVFGSYLTGKEKLGDIDIALELGPKERHPPTHWKLAEEQAQEAPRGNMVEMLFWPQLKVRKALRDRHGAFSFHEFTELEEMEKEFGTRSEQIYRNKAFDCKSFFGE
jgi:predicted nucleotidyltransferase